jgi:CelD/BcsL family acetyltransferase involved in cellulose biosynthesis
MMIFNIICYQTFVDAEDVWREFQKTASMFPFQDYDLLENWYRNIGLNEGIVPLLINVTSGDGSPLLFLPFGIRKANSLRRLEWLGRGIFDYGAPILHEDFSKKYNPIEFSSIWKAIKRIIPNVDLIALENQPPFINKQINPFIQISKDSLIGKSYCAELPREWSDFISIEPRKKISVDSLRQLKRLKSKGDLNFIFAKTKENIEAILAELMEQKKIQYHQTKANNIFSKNGVTEFYKDASIQLINKEMVQLSALILDGEILACHWGLIYQNRYYYLMPSYRRDRWEKYSAGRILMEHLIKWSIDIGLEEFDFTIGDENYKKNWSTKKFSLHELVESRTLKGIPYYLTWLIKIQIRNNKFIYRYAIKLGIKLSKIQKK